MNKICLQTRPLMLALALALPMISRAALPPMPVLTVTSGIGGEAAITALGNNLSAVAAHYGETANQLIVNLRADQSLRLDSRGNLYYVCAGLVVASNTPAVDSTTGLLFPLTNTFLLHSKPGSTKTIYLDFTGFTISGTSWNADFTGGNDIVAPPWDVDGNPGSFSPYERTQIQEAWFRVAEDYAGFDVDVTTEYPGEAALTRSDLNDQVYGERVLISPISALIAPAGGIAYLGIFNEVGNFHKPALIFPENLANLGRYIGEACSHEVGHNVSLHHQGKDVNGVHTEYYDGQGNWAPIMGVGYYKPIVQWAKGEYLNANNQEDALALITSTGLDYRTNNFGVNFGTATQMRGTSSLTNGIISRTGEADFFYFQTGSGTAWISVTNWEISSDLHEVVTVYDNAGTVVTNVASVDDATIGTQGVSFRLNVIEGKYYVAITGAGSGDPVTTGYSAYGSLGQYSLAITNPPGGATVIDSPRPPYGTSFTNVLGGNPNGPWYLFVQDDRPLDAGSITNGWFVTLTTASPVGLAADSAIYVTPTNSISPVGASYHLVIAVTNYGPSAASNVVVTEQLPSPIGLGLVSSNLSFGSVTQVDSTLTWTLTNLQANSGATMNLTFLGNLAGVYSNTVSVASMTTDPNPDDDVATTMVTVSGSLTRPTITSSFGMGGSGFHLTVTGDPTSTIVQASTNLINWANVYTSTPPFVFTNYDSTNFPMRFYRASVGP